MNSLEQLRADLKKYDQAYDVASRDIWLNLFSIGCLVLVWAVCIRWLAWPLWATAIRGFVFGFCIGLCWHNARYLNGVRAYVLLKKIVARDAYLNLLTRSSDPGTLETEPKP